MKVRYEHGGSHGSDDDPIAKILANQLAADRAGMMEGYTRVGDDVYETPFPSGAIQSDRPYMLDLMGLGSLGKSALKYLTKKGSQAVGRGSSAAAKSGIDPTDVAALKKSGMSEDDIFNFVTRTDNKAAVKAAQEATAPRVAALRSQMQNRKLQTAADRIIQKASKDESQAILNLQGQLDKAVSQGIIEEAKAVKIFEEAVDNVFTQARLDDKILGGTERVARQLGPTMQELYNTNRPLFNKVYNDLIRPVTSKKIDGAVNPRMNQFGGVIKVVKK